MPERTKPRRDDPARSHSFGGTGDTGDAWARVRREISHVARQTGEQIQLRWFGQASALLRYHTRESLNPAYRELLDDAGVDPAAAGQTAATWSRLRYLADLHRQAAATLVPAGQHAQMIFRLGRSPGPLPPTARRDPTWVAS
jgi:hypothetical protein